MSLTIGDRFAGHFEVTAVLGAGGMGEVYSARDTRLNRAVALKILPDAFAADPDRLARFQREAELLASLNHPNIAQIHGIEEEQDGTRALVLELVEGPTLEERIAAGPLALADALEDCRADRGRPRGGARGRSGPPRPQAGQRQGARGRHRQGARLRAGEGAGGVVVERR